jgi:hypothetical protein
MMWRRSILMICGHLKSKNHIFDGAGNPIGSSDAQGFKRGGRGQSMNLGKLEEWRMGGRRTDSSTMRPIKLVEYQREERSMLAPALSSANRQR